MTRHRAKSAKKYSAGRLTWMVVSAFFVICCGLPGFAAFIAKPTPVPPTVAALGISAQKATAAKAVKAPPTLPVAAGETYATVIVNRLNVRSDPGNGGVLLGTLGKGERVKLESRVKDGSWVSFTFKGRRGWISAATDLVTITGEGLTHVMLIDVATRPAVTSGPMSKPTAKAITAGGGSGGSGGGSCPRNCTEARARGYSAREAAACGLDRDGDGVACYGDYSIFQVE